MSRLVFGTYFWRRESGSEQVPLTGPVLLAANHASFIDPPLVGSSCPRPISCLARESLFSNRPIDRFLRAIGAVPVDRDGASGKGLKTILERLASGDAIVLFPEGTRSRDGRLQPARAGVGLVVLKSGAPVVPVRVFGTFEAFGRHHRLPRPRPIGVRYGPALRFDAAAQEAATAPRPRVKEIYQEVADAIIAAIDRLEPP
jgi:1-acyl-sn-glycerol-3-phosphate acyltransferase